MIAAFIAVFHAGWFVESMWTQTLAIHMIRTPKIPFIQSRAAYLAHLCRDCGSDGYSLHRFRRVHRFGRSAVCVLPMTDTDGFQENLHPKIWRVTLNVYLRNIILK